MENQSNVLFHHGIKGQKWGIRRYQNLDGTLTPEGKKRYREIYEGEGYDAEYRKRVNSLGSNYQKVLDQWSDTLDDVYNERYDAFTSIKKKQINEGLEKYRELASERSAIYSAIRAEEVKKRTPNIIREIFESNTSKVARNIEINTAATERAKSNPEYKELTGKLTDVWKKVDKLQGELKTSSMEKIISRLPKKEKQAAYELMRYYWWDPD